MAVPTLKNLYTVKGRWSGSVSILPQPRGGDWLSEDIALWKKEGVDVVVSTLTPEEVESLDLTAEPREAEERAIEFVSFPIPDRGTPTSTALSAQVFRLLERRLNAGKHLGIHCRQGVGRSALVAATLLILAGIAPVEAWTSIENARGCVVPDTEEQKAWVVRFARFMLAGKS